MLIGNHIATNPVIFVKGVELGLYAPEGTATDLRFTYSQAHIALSLYFL